MFSQITLSLTLVTFWEAAVNSLICSPSELSSVKCWSGHVCTE